MGFHVPEKIIHNDDDDTFIQFASNNIYFRAGSSTYHKLNINSSGVVFNESHQDYDFRVESDNNTNMFFIAKIVSSNICHKYFSFLWWSSFY